MLVSRSISQRLCLETLILFQKPRLIANDINNNILYILHKAVSFNLMEKCYPRMSIKRMVY